MVRLVVGYSVDISPSTLDRVAESSLLAVIEHSRFVRNDITKPGRSVARSRDRHEGEVSINVPQSFAGYCTLRVRICKERDNQRSFDSVVVVRGSYVDHSL